MTGGWPAVGDRVAEVTYHRWSGGGSVTFATVTKAGARDIVLDNGRRYSRKTLRPQGDSFGPELAPADHPSIDEIRMANRRIAAVAAVRDAHDEWSRHKGRAGLDELISAAQAIAALLDEGGES